MRVCESLKREHPLTDTGPGADPQAGAHEPTPLTRVPPKVDEFPLDALPKVLGEGVNSLMARTQAPMALCAQSLLAATNLAAQGHRNVQLPTGHVRPLSEYFLAVAVTGERKTSVDDFALEAVKERQKKCREVFEVEIKSHRNKLEAYESERREILKNKELDLAAKEVELQALPEPQRPLGPLMTCGDPTVEGLTLALKENQPSVAIISSEGGALFGGSGYTEEAVSKTAAHMSQAWDCGCLNRVRAKDGVTDLVGRRISMHVQIQPVLAPMVFSNPILLGQGFLARVLPVAPESKLGTRFWKDVDEVALQSGHRCQEKIAALLKAKLPIKEGTRNELDPTYLRFDEDARGAWIAFSDSVERRLTPDGDLRPISGFAAKMAEHVARLAGTLRLFEVPNAQWITKDDIKRAARIVEFYAKAHLHLLGVSVVSSELGEAESLLDWFGTKWQGADRGDYICSTDLLQLGPALVRDIERAKQLMGTLERHGYVERWTKPVKIRGKVRRESWRFKFDFSTRGAATPATPATPLIFQ